MKHIFMMKDTKKHHDFEKEVTSIMTDYDCEFIYTTSIQASVQYIRRQSTPSRFYAVGGDGTIHGLIQALVHSQHEVVVIPLGTGNDFCRTLTKQKNPVYLLRQSLKLQAQKVDTILLNDIYYINAACFGLDSVIANRVHDARHIPFVPDSKSYIISILQNTLSYNNHFVKILSNHQLIYQGETILCTVNNAQYYGGGFQIIPHADIQDGYMDICVVDKVPKWKIPYMVERLVRHKLAGRQDVHYFRVKNANIICSYSCNVDGEEMVDSSYCFQMQPASLNIVIYK